MDENTKQTAAAGSLEPGVRCADCQYWNRVDWGPDDHGECKHPMMQSSEEKSFRGDGIVAGGDPYYSLFTGPRFGCVHSVKRI